jgi:hypothetical protein
MAFYLGADFAGRQRFTRRRARKARGKNLSQLMRRRPLSPTAARMALL